MGSDIVFIDCEVIQKTGTVKDIGAVRENAMFHSGNKREFSKFISGADYICGHNIINHDLKYLKDCMNDIKATYVDTLYISPLLFPKKPYHKLLKDYKLNTDELNDPLNDSKIAKDLFYDEVDAFYKLPEWLKEIYCGLLFTYPEFQGFFVYNKFKKLPIIEQEIKRRFEGKICENSDVNLLIKKFPVELAYALALIYSDDQDSITPSWVMINYPKVENVIKYLRQTPCDKECSFCREKLNPIKPLKRIFGYDSFRKFDGEPLQEYAVNAAVKGKSLLTIFPTGGGKSIAFQLPALMAAETIHGLTIVISPLISLMKDQIDNLKNRGVDAAVAISSTLNPFERQEAFERVKNGSIAILYIAPEQLRLKTIKQIILSRNISRFVIDEAHCFSSWGQDFRVDYLYVGEFIKDLQKEKGLRLPIPVSCFTATAKPKVISDICSYFKEKLNLDLEIFACSTTRKNLKYFVIYSETDEDKYRKLRSLIKSRKCSTIVYVSWVKTTELLAGRLTDDGITATFFHGKMDSKDKIENQEKFMNNKVKVIVATSAFGMGVDKKDVKLVVHYEISDSLENYVQEAGRAGREETIEAECYVLYNENDLNKHFSLLNQTKLTIHEIQQIWRAIKAMTKSNPVISCSPLELARKAGWNDEGFGIETRVTTAVSTLENTGYIKRGYNVPHVYATSICAKNMIEAANVIDKSILFNDNDKPNAKRIIGCMISSRSIAKADKEDGESRIDYIADRLGIHKREVINMVNIMREIGLLGDSQDMTAYIYNSDSCNKSLQILNKFITLENYLYETLSNQKSESCEVSYKKLNENALNNNIESTVKNIRTIIYYWITKGYIVKNKYYTQNGLALIKNTSLDKIKNKITKRTKICKFIVELLYKKIDKKVNESKVLFSTLELLKNYKEAHSYDETVTKDIEDALLYLSKIEAISLQGGFLVLYNEIEINRLFMDNEKSYGKEEYHLLNNFYKQKIQQIHMVGEYANLMVKDYNAAMKYVNDYFHMDFNEFIAKYFEGERAFQIERNISPERYQKLFGELSDKQLEIIKDDVSKYIVVAAGPGSGKTKVLVHKLTSLLLLEEIKQEQLLMITFSRAAATEFKKRLIELIGNSASYIEIRTFHSYCFNLMGRIGSIEKLMNEDVINDAINMINNGDVEPIRITKTVLVIDEAQDMDEDSFKLVKLLMKYNENMRVIAVGDDDQNIYQFRGSNSSYFKSLIDDYGATKYEMIENYRSKAEIVKFANYFAKTIPGRMKTTPLKSVLEGKGIVKLIYHNYANMEQDIVNQILKRSDKEKICVLTNTNEESQSILNLLIKNNCNAKLIQTIEGSKLYTLNEIQFFLKEIDKERVPDNPLISNQSWENAKAKLKDKYQKSYNLSNCLKMIEDFEITNEKKYRLDLDEFIRESEYEDFFKAEKNMITVSTIHKAKGQEFDCVYMLLNHIDFNNIENKRKVYVGITRAKNELYIHYNNNIFKNIPLDGFK